MLNCTVLSYANDVVDKFNGDGETNVNTSNESPVSQSAKNEKNISKWEAYFKTKRVEHEDLLITWIISCMEKVTTNSMKVTNTETRTICLVNILLLNWEPSDKMTTEAKNTYSSVWCAMWDATSLLKSSSNTVSHVSFKSNIIPVKHIHVISFFPVKCILITFINLNHVTSSPPRRWDYAGAVVQGTYGDV